MTRGTMVLFTKDKVFTTTEFNGDMYFEGNGEQTARIMRSVENESDLIRASQKVNEYYGYPEEEVGRLWALSGGEYSYNDCLDTKENYFAKYFSDYLFIKNKSGRDLLFTCEDGNKILPDDSVGVLYFGKQADDFPKELNAFYDANDASVQEDKEKTDTMLSGLTDAECEELKRIMPKGKVPISMWESWEEIARQDAEDTGILMAANEKYFDLKLYTEDFKNLPHDDLFELSTGKVISVF